MHRPDKASVRFQGESAPRRRLATAALVLAALLQGLALPATAQSTGEPALQGEALLQALRAGGFNLYFRHAATEWSQGDRISAAGDWESCDPERVRQLSAAGRADAAGVGAAMRRLAVPVGSVYASPYCRTMETARQMGIGEVEPTEDVLNLRAASFVGGREAVIARARERLSSAPADGTNNVYVAHGNVGVSATSVYPGEGEGVVFRPLVEGRFEFVGRLDPAQWKALAERHAEP